MPDVSGRGQRDHGLRGHDAHALLPVFSIVFQVCAPSPSRGWRVRYIPLHPERRDGSGVYLRRSW